MCCCAEPNINGQPGYSWDGQNIGKHPPSAPELAVGDTLLFDEPGRCGGLDGHSYHFRFVKGGDLLVRHGGGDERIRVSLPRGFSLEAFDSNTRFWLLHAIYYAHHTGEYKGRNAVAAEYRQALAEGRLKKRKMPGRDQVKVWIEPRIAKGVQ